MADKPTPLFSRAVIALNGGPCDIQIVRLVVEAARPSKAEIVAIHVVEIDWTLPIDANVADRSESAQRVLDTAETAAEQIHGKLEPVLVQARDVGAAIVDEAVEREADLVVVGLAHHKRFGGDFVIGRSVRYVLKNAACAVWVVREPMPGEIHR